MRSPTSLAEEKFRDACQKRREPHDWTRMTAGLHFEDWAAAYGSPDLIDEEAPAGGAAPVQPAGAFAVTPGAAPGTGLAVVGGGRRLGGPSRSPSGRTLPR